MRNKKLIRQFIKSKTSLDSNATNLALIPLNKDYFFNPLYWKNMIKQGSVDAENRCLISLLQGADKDLIKTTCTGNLITRQEISENIYLLSHKFGIYNGFMLVINRNAIFEITCSDSSLISNCNGLCVVAIASECKVLVSSEIIKGKTKLIRTFKPVLVLNRNVSIIQDFTVKAMELLDMIQFIIIGVVLCIMIFILMCGVHFFCCNKNVIVNTQNMNEEEKVEFIEKQTEGLTLIGKIKK